MYCRCTLCTFQSLYYSWRRQLVWNCCHNQHEAGNWNHSLSSIYMNVGVLMSLYPSLQFCRHHYTILRTFKRVLILYDNLVTGEGMILYIKYERYSPCINLKHNACLYTRTMYIFTSSNFTVPCHELLVIPTSVYKLHIINVQIHIYTCIYYMYSTCQ